MLFICERCKKEIYKYEACNYCGRKICNDCTKSSARSPKTRRLVICKDCWSNMDRRHAFKTLKDSAVKEAVE
jgi:hypothetical protein